MAGKKKPGTNNSRPRETREAFAKRVGKELREEAHRVMSEGERHAQRIKAEAKKNAKEIRKVASTLDGRRS